MGNKEQYSPERKRTEKVMAIDKKPQCGTLRGARYSFCSKCGIMNLH